MAVSRAGQAEHGSHGSVESRTSGAWQPWQCREQDKRSMAAIGQFRRVITDESRV